MDKEQSSWRREVLKVLIAARVLWAVCQLLGTNEYIRQVELQRAWIRWAFNLAFIILLIWEALAYYRHGTGGRLVWCGGSLAGLAHLINGVFFVWRPYLRRSPHAHWLLIPYLAGLGLIAWGIVRCRKDARAAREIPPGQPEE